MIRNRGLTAYAVARGAGLDPGIVSRFLAGQRDLRLASADAIAGSLGLKLVESATRGRGKARPSDGAPADTGPPAPAPGVELDGPPDWPSPPAEEQREDSEESGARDGA